VNRKRSYEEISVECQKRAVPRIQFGRASLTCGSLRVSHKRESRSVKTKTSLKIIVLSSPCIYSGLKKLISSTRRRVERNEGGRGFKEGGGVDLTEA
jgi:hypothetical protein